jgi:hypothetical protein
MVPTKTPVAPLNFSPEEIEKMRTDAAFVAANEAPVLAPEGLAVPQPQPQPAPMPQPDPQPVLSQVGGVVPVREVNNTSTSFGKLSPEYKQAMGEQEAAIAGQEAAIDRETKIAEKAAQEKAVAAQQRLKEEQQLETQRKAVEEESAAAIKTAEAAHDEKVKAVEKFGFKSLWAEATTARKAIATLGLVLGTIGAAMQARGGQTNAQNQAFNSLMRLEEDNHQRQKDQLAKMKDEVIMARTGIQDAREARDYASSQLEVKRAAIFRRIETALDARIAEIGTEAAAASAAGLKAELQTKAAEAKLRHLEPTIKKVEVTKQEVLERLKPTEGLSEALQDQAKSFRTTFAPEIKAISEAQQNLGTTSQLEEQLREAVAKNNSVLMQQVMLRISTAANEGRLTDADGKRLMDTIGDYGQQAKDFFSKGAKGIPSAETVQQTLAALSSNSKSHRRVMVGQREELIKRAGTIYPTEVIEAVVPNPASYSERLGQSQGKGKPRLSDKDDEEASLFLKNNPNHPRAQMVADALKARKKL